MLARSIACRCTGVIPSQPRSSSAAIVRARLTPRVRRSRCPAVNSRRPRFAAGRKAEALKHYQDLIALLKRELNTEPDPATNSLVAELRRTQPSSVAPIVKSALLQPDRRDDGEVFMKVLIVDDHALIRGEEAAKKAKANAGTEAQREATADEEPLHEHPAQPAE